MAKKPVRLSSQEARRILDKDVEAFLKAGNKIQVIPSGVSGQNVVGGRKQLIMGPKSKSKPEPPKPEPPK